jgi:heme-degrading monooxygenase HmoA
MKAVSRQTAWAAVRNVLTSFFLRQWPLAAILRPDKTLLSVLLKTRIRRIIMVKHIVLYTLKEGVDKTEAVKLIASVLEPLVGKIPGLLHLEIRQAFNGMDYALYSEFESREALENYAVHPLHQEAKTHFFHLLDSRVAADYEV